MEISIKAIRVTTFSSMTRIKIAWMMAQGNQLR
jgi:hypothetical protein